MLGSAIDTLLKQQDARIIYQGVCYQMPQLQAFVQSRCAWLADNGLAGQTVAICLPNSPALFCWQMACLLTGTILVPVIASEPDEFVRNACALTKPKCLIVSTERLTAMQASLEDSQTDVHAVDVDTENAAMVRNMATSPAGDNQSRMSVDSQPSDEHSVSPETLALLMFSSGSSGVMKGIMHTHASTWAFVENLAMVLSAAPGMTYLVAQPMGHIGGIATTLLTLSHGGTVVLMREFDTAGYLQLLSECRPTHINLHTPLFYDIVDSPHLVKSGFERIECCFAAGDNLAVNLPERFTELTGAPMRTGYGMTETGILTVNLSPYGSNSHNVGKPLPGMRIEIRDEHGVVHGPDQPGEIWSQSPVMFKGYWQRPDLNRFCFADGWFKTGDCGYINNNGELVYTGRSGTSLRFHGRSINPTDIEQIAYGCRSVNKACLVASVKHPTIALFVELDLHAADELSEREALGAVRDALAEHASYLHDLPIERIDKMPLNMTGKIDRLALIDRLS